MSLRIRAVKSSKCTASEITGVEVFRPFLLGSIGQCIHVQKDPYLQNTASELRILVQLISKVFRDLEHSLPLLRQKQKHFSPLGTNHYFHVTSSRKNSIVLIPNMAALSRECKTRIVVCVQQNLCCLCSCSLLFFSLPVIFTLLAASFSHLLTAAMKSSRFPSNKTRLLCF